jgi:peptide/nickel transport system substrate-binding protein
MMPPKYLKEKGDVEFGKLPVGTGPYKVERFVKNDRLVLVANEQYWRGAPR